MARRAVEHRLELTDAELAEMRPARELHGAEEFAALTAVRKRGRPKVEAPKQPVTIRLDADIAEALRSSGGQWQTRLNAELRTLLIEKGYALKTPPTRGVLEGVRGPGQSKSGRTVAPARKKA